MEYLLDTHTFLWFINGDNRLSKNAKNAITDPGAINYISIASLWEIAIKLNIGKLTLDMPFEDLRRHTLLNGFQISPITFEHTLELCTLENHHSDPFDRIIIVQAFVENFTIISIDSQFTKYKKLKLLW